jgi:hypothetical protein
MAPHLSQEDKIAAVVYFPAAHHQQNFDSYFGRWRWKSVRDNHQPVYDYLLAQQAFTNVRNKWLPVLRDLANKEHIDLVPQKQTNVRRDTLEIGRISILGPGTGAIRLTPQGVTFSGTVRPSGSFATRVEVWTDFKIEGHDVRAIEFCKTSCRESRRIIQEMTDKFGLS